MSETTTKVTESTQCTTRSTSSKTTLQLARVAVPTVVRRSSRFSTAALNMRSVKSPLNFTCRTQRAKATSAETELYPRRKVKNLLDPAHFKLRGLNRNRYLDQGPTLQSLEYDEALKAQEAEVPALDSKLLSELAAARQAAQQSGESKHDESFGSDFFAHLAKTQDLQEKSRAASKSIVKDTQSTVSDFSNSTSNDTNTYEQFVGSVYTQDNKALKELGLSAQDLEDIEKLRRDFKEQDTFNGRSDDLDQESISDLSARLGLGRLGQDEGNKHTPTTPSVRGYTYEDLILTKSKPKNQQGSSSYVLDTKYGQSSGYHKDEEQDNCLSTEQSFADNSFNLSPTALKTNADNTLYSQANILQAENPSIDSIAKDRMENLSQSHNEMQENELQFKGGFLKQAHLPGAVLYDHTERLVYVDPSAAALLNIVFDDVETSNNEVPANASTLDHEESQESHELYPTRIKFHLTVDKSDKALSSYENVYPEHINASAHPSAWPTEQTDYGHETLIDAKAHEGEDGNVSMSYSGHRFHKTKQLLINASKSNLEFAPYNNTNSSMTFESFIDSQNAVGEITKDSALDPELVLQNELYQKATQAAKASMEADHLMHINEVEKLNATPNSDPMALILDDQSAPHDLSNVGKNSNENHGVHYLSLLRLLGRDFAHQFFRYLRYLGKTNSCSNPLKCRFEKCPFGRDMAAREARNCPYVRSQGKDADENQRLNQASDSISFELEMHKGQNRSFLYVRASAFYSPQGDLLSISFNLSQQASRDFALLPNVLTDNAICDWDIPSEHYCFSPNYYRMVGYPVNSPDMPTYVPDWINTMVHPDDLCKVYEFHHRIRTMRNHDCFEIYYRLKRADGNYFWCKVTGVVISRDKDGNAMHIIGAFSNINHVVDSYEKIRNKIYTDVLTGLKNRAYMQSRLPYLLHPAHQPLGIIFVDATALKLYNDYLSHTAGDRLLITLTSMLNNSVTDPKDLVRLSGDEFVCLVPHCTKSRMEEIEGHIIEARRQYNLQAPVRMPVFFSFGSTVLDLNESFYKEHPHLLKLSADEQVPAEVLTDARELFYITVQASDLQMQYYKRHNKHNHYDLIKSYIENILKYSISLNDSRMSINFTH